MCVTRILVGFLVLLWCVSCVSRPKVLPPIEDSSSGLKLVDIERALRTREAKWLAAGGIPQSPQSDIPIIDIHSHGFNVEYLPANQVINVRASEVLNIWNIGNPVTWILRLGNAVRYPLQGTAALVPGFHRLVEKQGWAGDPITIQSLALLTAMLGAATSETAEEFVALKARYPRRFNPSNGTAKLGFAWLYDHARGMGLAGDEVEFRSSQALVDVMARRLWSDRNDGRVPTVKDRRSISRVRATLLLGELENMAYLGARAMLDEDPKVVRSQYSIGQKVAFSLRRIRCRLTGRDADDYTAERAVRTVTGLVRLVEPVFGGHHLGSASAVMDEVEQGSSAFAPHESGFTRLEGAFWMLVQLTRPWQHVPQVFYELEQPQAGMIVQHMMAMNTPMNQSPGPVIRGLSKPSLLDYREQVERMQTITLESAGRATYFVAWDPFVSKTEAGFLRENLGKPLSGLPVYPEALRRIDEAIRRGGALGVKFYPPMGYRPIGNGINYGSDLSPFHDRPLWPFDGAAKRRAWQARYDGGDSWAGETLDYLNDLLFQYCSKHRIPIFSHSNNGEMAASANYGRFANPRHWVEVLERHPELRLCFGHAGGGEFWFEKGTEGHQNGNYDWGKLVLELCQTYPNVYCEVGIHDAIADPGYGARFALKMDDLLYRQMSSRYPLSRKIMYGTDWFMPIHEPISSYLDSYLAVWDSSPMLRQHKVSFFSGNAVRFLLLDELAAGHGIRTAPGSREFANKLTRAVKSAERR